VENEDIMTALLSSRPELQPVPDEAGRWQRTWLPGRDGGDGFFAARLQKMPARP
jgi:16S rRNA C967 or C1407 C5-methylase (RsmB/RsmF family)